MHQVLWACALHWFEARSWQRRLKCEGSPWFFCLFGQKESGWPLSLSTRHSGMPKPIVPLVIQRRDKHVAAVDTPLAGNVFQTKFM